MSETCSERVQAAYDYWRAETRYLGDRAAFEAGYMAALDWLASESALEAGYTERPDCPSVSER